MPTIKKDPEIEELNQEIAAGSREVGTRAFTDSPTPDFMKGYKQGAGTEAIGSDALEIPRLKLLHATTPGIEKFDKAKPGDWWDVVAEENRGRSLRFVPCFNYRSAVLFHPLERTTVLARTRDMKTWTPSNTKFEIQLRGGVQLVLDTSTSVEDSKLLKWGTSEPGNPDSPPVGTEFINTVAYLLDLPDECSPVVISFGKSGFKIGRKMMTQLKLATAPSFGCVYKLESERVDGGGVSYLEPRCRPAGKVQDEVIFRRCEELYERFRTMEFEILGQEELDEAEADAPPF